MSGLTLKRLREVNKARAIRWQSGRVAPLSFAMMELAGECGEACNIAKKMARLEMGWPGGELAVDALAFELADVVICADLAAERAGIDLQRAVVLKFNQTSEKRGFPERLDDSAEMLRPKRPFVFNIEVGADTPREMEFAIGQIAADILNNINCQSVSGGPSSGWTITADHTPGKTHEQYIEELTAYLEARKNQAPSA